MNKSRVSLLFGVLLAWPMVFAAAVPYQANGIKIGEVDSNSAIIWTRLTREAESKSDGLEFPLVNYERDPNNPDRRYYPGPQIPEGHTLEEMDRVTPGAEGWVRLKVWPENHTDQVIETEWAQVDPDRDFTHQFRLNDLAPDTTYHFVSEGKSDLQSEESSKVKGVLKTAQVDDKPERVVFTVVTGQEYHRRDNPELGHQIYPVMSQLNPNFFVHTGDILYYDKAGPQALSVELARFKWNRIYGMPFQRAFHNRTPSYFIKDDHDTWQNDCWPTMENNKMGDFTFEEGQAIYLEQVPMGEKTYRTYRWGKDLQIWLVEGRDYRSPNDMPDGPEKTIWGKEQMEWFKRTVEESDAAFRLLISPTPIVGPDRENKHDNHANKDFKYEGDLIRQFISKQKNMYVVCGDRHWQYVSVDPKTGVEEFCSGPTSEAHAGGFSQEDRSDMHRYLNICGGFLSGTVDRADGKPTLTFRHHSVAGEILNEEVLRAE
ncbi:MAG: alkaline phosphatase D family protein [Candidatus Omnitrophica bacterium]|nr:alkaline phosphatase D family protein [Candidatus Omnitrophota bacterium]